MDNYMGYYMVIRVKNTLTNTNLTNPTNNR